MIPSLLSSLEKRLPELLCKLRYVDMKKCARYLPPGVFFCEEDAKIEAYIACIYQDIAMLRGMKNTGMARFLVKRIYQRIHILVMIANHTSSAYEVAVPTVTALKTRQQWIQDLEIAIQTKEKEKYQLTHRLEDAIAGNTEETVIAGIQSMLHMLDMEIRTLQTEYESYV